MTGKQRSYLKGLAHNLRPLMQLGKDGLGDSQLESLNTLLEDHELVKISFLENFPDDVSQSIFNIVEHLKCEYVQHIGNKLIVYRQSRNNPKIIIPGADNKRAEINLSKTNKKSSAKTRLSKKLGKISKPNEKKQIKERKLAEQKLIEKNRERNEYKRRRVSNSNSRRNIQSGS